jgi:flagellar basal-body rod modification protein FlgD
MTPGISGTKDIFANAGETTTPQGAGKVDKNMFLQLLVAQLRNQDPMNPSDGTQFVAQLAQFQQLEQGLNMGQDIAAMRTSLEQIDAALGGSNT